MSNDPAPFVGETRKTAHPGVTGMRRSFAPKGFQARMNSRMSGLMTSACVVSMPCG